MSDAREPVRWLEDPEGLPESLLSELPRYAQRAPAPALRDRIFAAVESRIDAPPIVPEPGPSRRGRWVRWGLGTGSALGLALLSHLLIPSTPGLPEPAAPPVSSSVFAPSEPTAPIAPEMPSNAPVAVPEQAAATATKPQRRTPRPTAVVEIPPVPPQDTSDPQAELVLLSKARRVLVATPARALSLTDEHLTQFARGVFAQEREVIAIEAFVHLGAREKARDRAAAFERAYPRSTHLERIRVILSAAP